MHHDWNISAVEMGRGATVVAVCRSCGIIRQVWLVASERGGKIDLAGECLVADRPDMRGAAEATPIRLES